MTPQHCTTLDGFLQLRVEHLKERHVSSQTVREAYSNAPKEAMCDLMKRSEIKFPKSEKKAGLLKLLEKNWDAIIGSIEGLMGCYGVYSTPEPPTPLKGTGILFVVKDRILYPTWTDQLKGFGVIEFKDLGSEINPRLDNGERLEEILDLMSKKTLEKMLSSIGMVARCSGAETWMTKDRLVGLVLGQWDRIMTKAGYVPLDMRLHQATEEEEEVARLNSLLQQLPPAQNLPTDRPLTFADLNSHLESLQSARSSSAPSTSAPVEGFVPFVGRAMKLSVDEPKAVEASHADYAKLYCLVNGMTIPDDNAPELPQWFLDIPQWYLKDCSDFTTTAVNVFEPFGRRLMTIEVDTGISVEELKVKVSDFITERAGQQTLPPDAFRLKGDDRGDVKVEGETINIILELLVRGGGISSVRKVEKMKQKTIEASKVLNTMATSVGADLKTIAVVKKAEDIIGNVHQLLQSNGAEATMKTKMMELVKSAPLVAKDVVKYLKESGSGSPEVKLRHLAEKFFQCEELSQKIEEFKAVSESIKSMMTICYNKLVMEMAEKGVSNYNLTNFRETLCTMIEMASADTAVALTRDDMVLL